MSFDNAASPLLRELEHACRIVRARAAEAERRSALPEEVVRWLVQHRLFRLWIPRRYGGFELSLPAVLEIYEAAARIDGSFGWAVMIGAGGGLFAAYLEEDTAREIFAPASAVIAGTGAPEGRAERVAGGYRVRGRWRYASGSPYATTFTANCIVTRDGEPLAGRDGDVLVRAMAFSRDDVEILETWDAAGMRGTASHDFRVDDVFVPERRSFSVFTDAPVEPGPLYKLPFQVLTELPVAAVALGIARHALDAFAELAAVKKPIGSSGTLADNDVVHSAFARARAAWRHARAGVFALAREAWSAAAAGRQPSAEQQAEITAACAHGVAMLRAAVDELVSMAGMAGIARSSDLGRAARDLDALGAHFSVSPRQLAAAGATLIRASG